MKVFVTVKLDSVSVMPAPDDDDEFKTIAQMVTVRKGEKLGPFSYDRLRKLGTGNCELELTILDFENCRPKARKG